MNDTHDSRDILREAARWWDAGRRVALATVIETWGSSPRGVGAHMIVDDRGRFMGSVSGGCIEGSVITEAEAVLAGGPPKLLDYGVSMERAWEVGLSCGGSIRVHLQAFDPDDVHRALVAAVSDRRAVTALMRLDDGRTTLIQGDGVLIGPAPVDADAPVRAAQALKEDRAATDAVDANLFVRPYNPPLRLLVVGGVHIAQALLPMAETAGMTCTLIDPRKAYADPERFPGATLVHAWPDEAMAELVPDAGTAVVTLTHDPKLDDPALAAALRSDAFYIGALGSRKTHEKRRARLARQFDAAELDRIHAPVGLKLGGRSPRHIAVSILAEIIQTRFNPPGA